ncbi:hypothetical protein GCM10012280_58600 [Wenjunlia tyrosinilytica]|uniref:Peptidase S8/S53 domain-containing protein n=1 Tax=Wenjunlia tyrosinilytica TaxID=1544741 RepID=A0A917ZWQ9_9ACTN|nr:hypothetical protein GCM10012280_58600 [Wenjunlia tyrosinilytica]
MATAVAAVLAAAGCVPGAGSAAPENRRQATGSDGVSARGAAGHAKPRHGTARSATGQAGGTPASGHGAGPSIVRTGVPWNLDRLDQRTRPLDGRFTTRSAGAGVHVYVIDTGLDIGHAQFSGRASLGADFVGEPDAGDCFDGGGLGHGTFVAGIIGGKKYGVAPKAKIVRVQAIKCEEGSGGPAPAASGASDASIVKAVKWVTLHARRPAVVNMSLNLDKRSAALDSAVQRMIDAGVPTVVSAGNFNDDACKHSPAGVRGAIVVAASTTRDRHWSDAGGYGSGHGRCVDLYAPGEKITSALAGGGTATSDFAATSWAAPHATGVAALYLCTHPKATPAQVQHWLDQHAGRGLVTGVPPHTPNRLLNTGHL